MLWKRLDRFLMGVLAVLAVAAAIMADPAASAGSAGAAAAASADATSRHISVRLHDYAGLDETDLRDTQEQVSEIYGAVGVVVDWRASVRPDRVQAGLEAWPSDPPATLSVLIVTEDMARGIRIRDEVAGYAAVNPVGGGSVAFMVADRARRIAMSARVGLPRIASSVIAHELAHLLMPNRPHSHDGLMKANWQPLDFRFSVSRAFSRAEAEIIRRGVARLARETVRADN